VRSATDGFFHACDRREIAGVQHHVAPKLRHEDWKDACAAAAAHHMSLATVSVTLHGDTATARVRCTTDHGHVAGSLRWHHDHDGWHMTEIPSVLTGTWDHDGHHWLSAAVPGHHDNGDHPSTSVPGHHGDGDHTSTSMAGHHDEGDHHSSTSVPRHHDDGEHTSTTVPGHHDEEDH
jgi:hypothetical protein